MALFSVTKFLWREEQVNSKFTIVFFLILFLSYLLFGDGLQR